MVVVREQDRIDRHQRFDVESRPEIDEGGVAVGGPVTDQGWGLLTTIRLPGGSRLWLYEARHPTAFDL